MRLLLDTHILLWLIFSPEKVPSQWLPVLKNADNQLYISSLTCWEISLKYGLGKLTLEGATPEEIPELAQQMGIDILVLSASVLASIHKLIVVDGHKDPFDRALVWSAISEKLTLVSCDQKLSAYQLQGLSLLY